MRYYRKLVLVSQVVSVQVRCDTTDHGDVICGMWHVTCVVCDHSRAHTLDDDSLTLETNSDPLPDARAQPVMGLGLLVWGARA